MMKELEVAILMSSYNGEKYISDQLDSIINQKYSNWKMYIRDDGSSDKTIDIIKHYERKDQRIQLIHDDIKHRGVKDSFLWLLRHIESDFYMFCDQDDVWETDKISESYLAAIKLRRERPILVCTDLSLVDSNLNIINNSMWQTHHLNKLVDYPNGLIIANMYPGCSMFFNKTVRDLSLKENYDFKLHDNLISMVTYKSHGFIIPIHRSLIKYRQHSNNVVGLYSGNNWFLDKLKKISLTIDGVKLHYKIVHDYLGVSKLKFIRLKFYHILNVI